MNYTAYIDNTIVVKKHFVNKNHEDIEFANPAVTGIIPDGYMTGDECKRKVITGLKNRFQENGFLQ